MREIRPMRKWREGPVDEFPDAVSARWVRVLALAASILLAAGSAAAQTTGLLQGTLTDPSGAIIPQAKVTAIQEGTDLPRSTVSDRRGEYGFPALAVGAYRVEIDAPGFKRYVREHVEVTLGHVVVVDAELELGTIS